MKRILLSSTLLILCLGIFAQTQYLNVGINFRTDYNALFSNDQANIRKINLNTLKLVFSGTVYPGITYKVQQRLNDTPFLESDKYTSNTEDAWINFALRNYRWDFTVGKQDILFGTFESNYDPSDMYLISMVFNNFNRSQVGLTARYRFSLGNTVSLQMSNVTGEQLSRNENHSFAYTVNATQNFFDNALNTTIGYSLIQSGHSRYYHWVTFGSQLQVKKLFVEFDAYAGRYRQNMTMDAEESNFREADNFSASLTDRYRINKFVLFAKLVLDYQKDAETGEMSKRSVGAASGVEFYPVDGQDLRIHGVYQFRHNKYGNPWLDREGTENAHQLTVGVKWNVNLGQLITNLVK